MLQLEKRCVLNKIQILVHQFLIRKSLEGNRKNMYNVNNFLASKIEILLCDEDISSNQNIEKMNWEYLGYITLSTNESTDFKSRELKSANVPKKQVTFIKMNLYGNHFNSHNTYNQVKRYYISTIILIEFILGELNCYKFTRNRVRT